MFHEFYESLLLSLEYTIFISTIFQSFIRSCKPRNVSIFNLMLFYQTFSLTMASLRFPGKGKKKCRGWGVGGLGYIVHVVEETFASPLKKLSM